MIVLRWQLKKWFNNCSLKTKITVATTLGHFCILFSLFVLYRGNEQYHILITGSMINTNVPIVFLPMHKSLKQKGGQSKSSTAHTLVSKSAEVQTVPVTKKGTIATALPEVKKTSKKKTVRPSQKKTPGKQKEKKAPEPEKPVIEKPKPVVQEIAVETPQQINTEAFEVLQPIQTIPLEAACPPSLETHLADAPRDDRGTPLVLSLTKGIGEGWDNPDVLYVGQQEMDALQMQDYIQQEMAQHWSPPAGMRKNIFCVIKITIAFDGSISAIEVEQSSGVLIFDGAAKRAASQLTPPAWAYGKEISLTFKP